MIDKEQIVAALKKLGPSSPTAIANTMGGAEPGNVGYHLRNMLKAGSVKAAGASTNRVYALPGQAMDGAKAAPPQERKKPQKRGKRAPAKPARSRAAAPADSLLPAITYDNSLVLVRSGEAPQIFSTEQTQAIADLLLVHFEA